MNDEAIEEYVEEEKFIFHGDSSNMDSSESDCPKPKKESGECHHLIHRAQRRGKYSMLRGLFKNTEDTPVILDDGDDVVPTTPQSSQRTMKRKSDKKR